DTRFDIGLPGTFTGGQSRNLDVTGAVPVVLPGNIAGSSTVVPEGATAIVANVTAIRPTSSGYVSVRPGDATGTPTTSNLNIPTAAGLYPTSVPVDLPPPRSRSGTGALFSGADPPGARPHLLFDVVGYYPPGGAGIPGPAGPAGPQGATGLAGPAGAAA